ncbi:MAG TPA: DUF2207 domain-containing protein [Aliicoccus persicus]|uniref:DUF2207 domain-containing protein n=1 Tax=Aliicoccus persicus TaxID=930138 RepID=A0A921DZH2_9STAP|nr:DUF2207 domain-containing protein [Aliicoccus persicus]
MKKYSIIVLLIISSMFLTTQVSANAIKELVMKVHINEDGSVDITEERLQNMDEGTENYMIFNDRDMGEVEVTNFSVDGYEAVEDWDSDASLEEKAGKYGILDTSSGQELVFGIGEYGSDNEYTVHYTLENMVRNIDGGQSLFWNFDTFSSLPTGEFTMEITSDVPFEDVNYWGFGFIGDIELIDDTIYWDSSNMVREGNDVIVLLHFPEGTYTTSVEDDISIDEEREQALDGSIYEEYLEDQDSMPTWAIWLLSIGGGLGVILVGIITYFSVGVARYKKEKGHIESRSTIVSRNKDYEEEQAPDVEDYAGIIYFVKHLTYEAFDGLFQVYLMKWNDEGRLSIELEEGEGWFSTDETTVTIHDYEAAVEAYSTSIEQIGKAIKAKQYNGSYEALMWRFLIEMADSNGKIDNKTLREFSKKNAKQFEILVDYLNEYSLEYLEKNGYIELDKGKKYGFPVLITRPTEDGEALLNHIAQHKNYLSKRDEEVLNNPFDESELKEHLKWATLLGDSTKYNKILETYNKEEEYRQTYYPYYLYHHATLHTRNQITTGLGEGGMSSAMSSAASAASGGGGATGGGGGGGAGGGGGGGAR